MFAVITPALITGVDGRPLEVRPVRAVRRPLGDRRLRPDRPLGLLARPAGCSSGVLRTSPVGRWSTPTPVPPPWPSPSCSASAAAGRGTTSGRTTCRSSCSAPACCGSAGSGSTPGSALGANNSAGYAFVNTNTATAAAMLGWLDRGEDPRRSRHHPRRRVRRGGRPGRHHPGLRLRLPDGLDAPRRARPARSAALCTTIKFKLGLDDSLDVGAVHLVGGVIGALLIGFLGDAKDLGGINGLFYGGGCKLLCKQLEAVGRDCRLLVRRDLHHRLRHQPGVEDEDDRGRAARGHGHRPAR